MCCKALHERHPGRGNSKAKLALVAFGERERGGVGVGLEHLDLPAARVLLYASNCGCSNMASRDQRKAGKRAAQVAKMDVKVQMSWAAFCLCSQYAAPGGMLLLIAYVGDYVDGPIAPKAFAFGALVAFGPLCSAVSDAHTFANGWLLGTKLRGYLAHAISHKALRLDAPATEQSTGQMVSDPPPP